jgi:hypothetical protein
LKIVENDSDSDFDDLATVNAEISKEILQIGAVDAAIDAAILLKASTTMKSGNSLDLNQNISFSDCIQALNSLQL